MNYKTTDSISNELPLLISSNSCYEIGLSKYQFNQLLKELSLPVVKVGSKKYIKRDEFMKWLNKVTIPKGLKTE